MSLELPHTPGCLVCGRENPHGMRLSLFVDSDTGLVRTEFTPQSTHLGFEGIAHGGAVATVIDEAMVWAATWAGRRFCLCGEMTVRFRSPAVIGRPLVVQARVEQSRARLITTTAEVRDRETDTVVAEAAGKYVPMPDDRNRAFVATLIQEPATQAAARELREAASQV